MGTGFPEPKDSYSPHDREWLRRIEESLTEFKSIDLQAFTGTVTCRKIDDLPSDKDGEPARRLVVRGNTVYRFHAGTVSMMIGGELIKVGRVNHNGRIIRASRDFDVSHFDPINYPGKPRAPFQYFIRAAVSKSDA